MFILNGIVTRSIYGIVSRSMDLSYNLAYYTWDFAGPDVLPLWD